MKSHFESGKTPIDIGGLEEFFKQGVTLKAIEVDDKNNLFLYGKHGSDQTVSGKPLSLSDFAEVYRSVFHYGHNAPYISLDRNEDNRYAKVNFGGLLQNTRVGSVVLEADKLFKALSTGIDPNSYQFIGQNIVKMVPDFLTEDARSLLGKELGKAKIRYWFYPDKIGTVTDGSIGAITSYQFLADVERMDKKVNVGRAQRQTIDHLNQNFSQYERAFHTFKELSTVGRMMALVTWLKGMKIDAKVDLDALLSVRLPAISTPKKTKKMLAITALESSANQILTPRYVRRNSKVFYLSRLLTKEAPTSSDDRFLQVARSYFGAINKDKLTPPEYRRLKQAIGVKKKQIKDLGFQLTKLETTLNRYNQEEVNYYNSLVRRHRNLVQSYNAKVSQINRLHLTTNQIVSVGGGINLRPNSFKKIVHDKHSQRISEIKQIKEKLVRSGTERTRNGWIRSGVSTGIHAYANKLPL